MSSRYVAVPHAARGGVFSPDAGERVLQSISLSSERVTITLDVLSVLGTGSARDSLEAEEALFVVRGAGALSSGGKDHALSPQSGAVIPAGTSYRLRSGVDVDRLEAVRFRVTAPGGNPVTRSAVTVRHLEDCETGAATGNRDFQVVADAASGFAAGTLFVGNVPPGPPAPVHYHTYDEVLFLLEGEGVLHIDGEHSPITPGSCYRLPARTLHQIENTGDATMREVAVFVPSGSPAAAYLPDGRGAFAGLADDPVGPARGSGVSAVHGQ